MRFISFLFKTFVAFVAVLAIIDVSVRTAFPHFLRLSDNFSAAYLNRAITTDDLEHKIVFVGDSVLWGYHIDPQSAAASVLMRHGMPVENLSFEGGSIVNTYVILRLMQQHGIKPRLVVFNVNLKEFNAADSAYSTLYPGLEQLSWKDLAPSERALLKQTQRVTLDAGIDRVLSRLWALYGMRSDIRSALFGDSDAASGVRDIIRRISGETGRAAAEHVPTPDKFLGTYDLSPLTNANVEAVFLQKTAKLLREEHTRAYAILTPQNHALLHDYIDVPDYDAQLTYVNKVLTAEHVLVLNYDRAFPASDFLDNDHLTASANVRLAQMLQRELHY